MGMMELFLIAVGLSMDAFAVAVCKGLALRKVNLGQMALVGLWFGGFQALMPLAGYFVGVQFKEQITAIDPVSYTHLDVYKRQVLLVELLQGLLLDVLPLVAVGEQEPVEGHVRPAVQQKALGGAAVPAGPARLLVVALQRLWHGH